MFVDGKKGYLGGSKEGICWWWDGRNVWLVGMRGGVEVGKEGGLVCLTTRKLRTVGAYFHCNDDILNIFKNLN